MRRSRRHVSAMVADAKNAIRGALGNKDAVVQEVLADTLLRLPEGDIPDFARWIDGYPAKKERIHPPRIIRSWDKLWPGAFSNIGNLSRAVIWVTAYLRQHVDAIRAFIVLLEQFEKALVAFDYNGAAATLSKIEDAFGLSIWLMEARISLLQRAEGLEKQKEYSRTIHAEAPHTVASFMAHYISQRNEESVSFARFQEKVIRSIEEQRIGDELKLFLKIRLVGTDTEFDETGDVACVLSAGASVSLIDAYDSLVWALQIATRRSLDQETVNAVRRCLSEISVPDWRLQKLSARYANDYTNIRLRSLEVNSAIRRGEFNEAVKLSHDALTRDPMDVDALHIAALAHASNNTEPNRGDLPPLIGELLSLLTAVRLKQRPSTKAASDLRKAIANLRCIRIAPAIYGFLAVEWFERVQTGNCEASSVFLCTSCLSPDHWVFLPRDAAAALLAKCQQLSGADPIVQLHAALFGGNYVRDDGSPPEFKHELNAITAIYHDAIDDALAFSEALGRSKSETASRVAARLELHCLLAKDNLAQAIRRTSAYCCDEYELREILPLKAMLAGKKWRDLKHLSQDISLPIVLDLFWRTISESEHETTRRIAYDEFLRAHHVRRPSDLAKIADKFPKKQLIYFLDHLCVPEVMDVSFDTYSTSREIEEERVRVCSFLSDLDPDQRATYAEEIKNITKYLSIQDGLRDVDRSRVHVNAEAVARWAEKEVKESFARYKELLGAGVGISSEGDFDEEMIKIVEGDKAAKEKYLTYPEQEGDSLLIEMFEAVCAEYLTNEDYGLDAYLSMRIRHGSLSGHMRGPLEEASLIAAKKETAGEYQDNVYWADKLHLDGHERNELIRAIRRFSAEYDSIIEDLTKNRLQIWSSEKPDGMFALNTKTYPLIVHFIRSRIHQTTTFFEFLQAIFHAIELLLHIILINVRDYILDTVKPKVETAVEEFRSSLATRINPDAYLAINSKIAGVMPDVQAAIDRVAEWFVPVEVRKDTEHRTFDELVDIGIEATRLAHRGFSPQIERQIKCGDEDASGFLSEFTDILFTILDNVYVHSGSVSPWVKIKVDLTDMDSSSRKLLKIRVESEIAENRHNGAAVAKLERIRQQMETGAFHRLANLEGGSGLLKLKRIVARDSRQTLEFGFKGQSAFFVEVGLVIATITSQSSLAGTT